MTAKPDRAVLIWIGAVIAMVFLMVVVGGITRLTESGLSMVDWRPVMGAIPPLGEAQWRETFAMYQQYPQYQQSFPAMELAEFKRIFFWEYLHRLLGRSVGLVFLLPFLLFWWRGRFAKPLTGRLLIALVLGGMQGLMGWYMVKSGLVDMPRVSHLRLAAHLGLALLIMAYLAWLLYDLLFDERRPVTKGREFGLVCTIAACTVMQIVYGAFVAGLRAGLGYNTFPKMGERWIAEAVGAMDPWWSNLLFSHATVQFLHRWLGAVLLGLTAWYWLRARSDSEALRRLAAALLFGLTLCQFLLGVFTLINVVPLVPAVLHQGVAAVLLLAAVFALHVQQGEGRAHRRT